MSVGPIFIYVKLTIAVFQRIFLVSLFVTQTYFNSAFKLSALVLADSLHYILFI